MLTSMTIPKMLIITLYCISGLLPIFGLLSSYINHRIRLNRESNREKHIELIDGQFEERKKAASTTEETARAQDWYNGENAKVDGNGKPYNIRGGVLFADDSAARKTDDYKRIRTDMLFVGIAVTCGAVASVWSLLLPTAN